MLKKLILLSSIFVSTVTYAGDFTGTIIDISSGPAIGTNLMIAVSGNVNNKISCNSNSYWDFAINTEAPGANAWSSMILLAFSTGKQVVLTGGGSCNNWHNVEDLSNIRISQ